MNEQYTIEELGLGRSKESHEAAIVLCILSEDVVLCDEGSMSLDVILDRLGDEFKRRLAYLAIDSQNPISSKIREAIENSVNATAAQMVNDIKQVF